MPRYVILRHDSPQGTHWDFMLEAGEVLKTWALPDEPRAGLPIECRALADHRLAYLDYEGPISGGRGSVTRWDRGTYTTERRNDAEWIVELVGERLTGTAILRPSSGDPNRWLFSFADA